MKILEKSRASTSSQSLDELLAADRKTLGYEIERIKVDLSNDLWIAMEEAGFTQADLARKMGKSRAYITKILRGNTNFTVETVAALLWVMGKRVEFKFVPKKAE